MVSTRQGCYAHAMFRNASRLLAWLLVTVVALVTWSPIALRPHLSGDPNLERALALGLVGMAFGYGYPRRIWLIGGAVLLGVISLEWSQQLLADRHGRLDQACRGCRRIGIGIARFRGAPLAGPVFAPALKWVAPAMRVRQAS